jgi:Type I phosphodiesterase / nucleotide pyrophosphatase
VSQMGSDHGAGKPPGLLIVQIDGLSLPVLQGLVRAGRVPVIARLLRRAKLTIGPWVAMLPSVTPASQAGILHGRNDDIPGFRWFEKSTGRLLVANHPQDATEMARRVSDGHGLLARGGASIGNLMTGDAPISHLTMATIEGDPSGHDRARRGQDFPLDPLDYLRLYILSIAELLKEAYEGRRQRVRDIRPRMYRGWEFAIERMVTNIPVRILSTALVAAEMKRGRPVIYVDYTAYDEIAHHAGPERPEAQASAEGIDRNIGSLLRVALSAPRSYRLVVLSDHGQSQGATFRQRYGVALDELIASLMGRSVSYLGATDPAEYHDSIGRIRAQLTRGWPVRLAKARTPTVSGASASRPELVVCASGNLALIYLNVVPERLMREEIEQRYPGLVDALAQHPGIGLLLLHSGRGLTAVGANGASYLDEHAVDGEDPVAQYGPYAEASLRRLAGFANSGDMVAIGSFYPATREVVQFEELIGSHGGLGGWQTEPFIAYPSEWHLITNPPVGAPALYQQLNKWLTDLGLHSGGASTPPPGSPPG